MDAAIALGERGRGRTAPNPHVGCIIVKDGEVVGRGWTQPGGRPHAEAVALAQAGAAAEGATVYVSLEPCAHESGRGPACADLLAAAKPARVVIAADDPDPRTNGAGAERLRAVGIAVETGFGREAAEASMAGFFSRVRRGRPFVTLKLALSIDGRIALASGESQWITGEDARAHAHLERARADMILVGRGTNEADAPQLDVRLPGLEDRSPRRALLTRGEAPEGWAKLASPEEIFSLGDVNDLLVEGGAGAAASFLAADLVDRLLVYRAPILIGDGKAAVGDIGLAGLADAHGRWRLADTRALGSDRLEVYERTR
ncbi:MAG: bifunctional diaminohydroxyphosphoribosylaminopyrimidine deaminase/5-amino-6-(5-phosphoribosylamino)uracil reductase RibD [Sphingosinicella sp.]|uniref:bifunctional diaminohydroxyphosphoribosylaminopyrimidine deaminase/5-amino-6-(5-phosphoribosylamino)uracil reductase RibD n=1 Tax=Sphingosinicella sp. TaxID=1917971 RepID=UPI004037D912